MSAPLLMVASTLLFATMGMCVKFVSAEYSTGEIVFYRGLVGAAMMLMLARMRGSTLKTRLPSMHFWRSLSGVSALGLWFYAIGELPLATAFTLNYMAPIWMVVFLIGGSVLFSHAKVHANLVATILMGFAGVVCVLQPTLASNQAWGALMGLLSGLLTGIAYIQVAALGRAGEPEDRVVFYFSLGSIACGAAATSLFSEWHQHSLTGLGLLLAVGLLATLAQLIPDEGNRAVEAVEHAGIGLDIRELVVTHHPLPREGREHVADALLAPPGAETSRVHEAVEAKHMSQRRNDRLQRLAALSGGDQRRQDRRHKPRALQHDLPRSQTVQHRFLDTLTELVARLPHRWTEPVIDDSLAIVPEHAYCDFSDALRNSRWCTVAALRSARQWLARSGGG